MSAACDPPTPAGQEPLDARGHLLTLLRRTDILVDSVLSPAVFVGVNLVAGLTAAAVAAGPAAPRVSSGRRSRRTS